MAGKSSIIVSIAIHLPLEVLAAIGLAPIEIELAVQRLRFYQSICKDVQHNKQYLAAVFGFFEFDIERSATKWELQFIEDFKRLSIFDDIHEVVQAVI